MKHGEEFDQGAVDAEADDAWWFGFMVSVAGMDGEG